jgi:hypothetical protein
MEFEEPRAAALGHDDLIGVTTEVKPGARNATRTGPDHNKNTGDSRACQKAN